MFDEVPHPPIDAALVLQKCQRHLLPVFVAICVLCYLDRTNLAFASVSLTQDLHFTPETYGLGAGLFYLGYSLLMVPSQLVLMRVGASIWLGGLVMAWGMVATSFCLLTSTHQFYALRFLLGATESGAFPGMWYQLTQFFPLDQLTVPFSILEAAVAAANVLAAPLAALLLQMDGMAGLRGWQWLFIAEGAPTIALGLLVSLLLPNTVYKAEFLTGAEKRWLQTKVENSRRSQVDTQDVFGNPAHIFDALGSARVWWVTLMGLLKNVAAHGMLFWLPIIVTALLDGTRGLGHEVLSTAHAPPGSLALHHTHHSHHVALKPKVFVPPSLSQAASNFSLHSNASALAWAANASLSSPSSPFIAAAVTDKAGTHQAAMASLTRALLSSAQAATTTSSSSSSPVALHNLTAFQPMLGLWHSAKGAARSVAAAVTAVTSLPMLPGMPSSMQDGVVAPARRRIASAAITHKAVLLSCVPFAAAAVFTLWLGHSSQKKNERALHLAIPYFTSAVLLASLPRLATTSTPLTFAALIVIIACVQGTNSIVNSYVPLVAPSAHSIPIALALYNSVANLGGLLGPWLIGEVVQRTGSYSDAMKLLGVCMALAAAMALGTRGWSRSPSSTDGGTHRGDTYGGEDPVAKLLEERLEFQRTSSRRGGGTLPWPASGCAGWAGPGRAGLAQASASSWGSQTQHGLMQQASWS